MNAAGLSNHPRTSAPGADPTLAAYMISMTDIANSPTTARPIFELTDRGDSTAVRDEDDDRFVYDASWEALDDVVERLEQAVIVRVQDEMGAWSESNQRQAVRAGRRSNELMFTGGDWDVFVGEDRYARYGHPMYDSVLRVVDAGPATVDSIATPMVLALKKSADEALRTLRAAGADADEISDISLESCIVLTLRVLDASPTVEYDDGAWDVARMPPHGVHIGVQARFEASERLDEQLRAGCARLDSRGPFILTRPRAG